MKKDELCSYLRTLVKMLQDAQRDANPSDVGFERLRFIRNATVLAQTILERAEKMKNE